MTYLLWKYTNILEICASMCVFYIYLCYICKLMCISVWYTLFYVYTVCPEYQIKMQHLRVLQSQVKIFEKFKCSLQSVKSVCKQLSAMFICVFKWNACQGTRGKREANLTIWPAWFTDNQYGGKLKIWHRQ